MIEAVVCHIDETLKGIGFLNKCYGLAESIATEDTPTVKGPAVFKGKDSYERISFEPGICYHRITGPMPVAYTEADDNGVMVPITLSYPLILVACVGCGDQTDIEIVQKLMYELSMITYTALKSKIKFSLIKLKIISSNVDRFAIWNTETDGAGAGVNLDKALVAINYQIEINTYTKCLNNC